MVDEFDDIVRHGPYVSSAKAHAETMVLVRRHRLGFLFDPGGGCFYGPEGSGFQCRITGCDDVEDLATLRAALRAGGLE